MAGTPPYQQQPPEQCGSEGTECSPDQPATTYYYCTMNFTGLQGRVERASFRVDSLETCVLAASEEVQRCVDGSTEPQIQAFHANIFTSMISAQDGERMYWDFYVTQAQAYDAQGNVLAAHSRTQR